MSLLTIFSIAHGQIRIVEDDQEFFTCVDGLATLHSSRVNDGTCDCEDGSDEPESSHCHHKRFVCGSEANFKVLFKSRALDGKCDCCDGSDEPVGVCANTCQNPSAHWDAVSIAKNRRHIIATSSFDQTMWDKMQIAAAEHADKPTNTSDVAEKVTRFTREDLLSDLSVSEIGQVVAGDLTQYSDFMNPTLMAATPDSQVEAVMEQKNPSRPTIVNGNTVIDAAVESAGEYSAATHTLDDPAEDASWGSDMPAFYHSPTVHENKIAFISEDDLWLVDVEGGPALSLRAGVGQVWKPAFSPDGKQIAFSASDEGLPDIYIMSVEGGRPRRLTYTGSAFVASWTPDGKSIIFTTQASRFHQGMYEELFVVPIEGGQPVPFGTGWASSISVKPVDCSVCSISKKDCSSSEEARADCAAQCESDPDICVFPESYQQEGASTDEVKFAGLPMQTPSVLGKFTSADPSKWKRYKGGQRGKLWIDLDGSSNFEPVFEYDPADGATEDNSFTGNIGQFAWVYNHIVFVSDHECEPFPLAAAEKPCVANLFVTEADPFFKEGEVRQKESAENRIAARTITKLTGFNVEYVRTPAVYEGPESATIVFANGADLYSMTLSPDGTASPAKIVPITYRSSRQQQRHFFQNAGYVTDYGVSPQGDFLSFVSRGRLVVFKGREKAPPVQYGEPQGVRYSISEFLSTGDLLAVTDEGGESAIEIFKTARGAEASVTSERIAGGRHGSDIGRIDTLVTSPTDNIVAMVNHESTLMVYDVESQMILCTLKGQFHPGIRDLSFSPDGRWLAFSITVSEGVNVVKIMRVKEGSKYNPSFFVCNTVDITNPLIRDTSPAWDPDGNHLYFLSVRDFDPQNDQVSQRQMTFVGSGRPFLVTLNAADYDPFKDKRWDADEIRSLIHRLKTSSGPGEGDELAIDLTGIKDRIIGFPVSTGRYRTIVGGPQKRVYYIRHPLEPWHTGSRSVLFQYDFLTQQEVALGRNVQGIGLSAAASHLVVLFSGNPSLCMITTQYRGGLDPSMMKCTNPAAASVEVVPHDEWRQILTETWRRARDNFWTASMNSMDWGEVLRRYLKLVDRINSRSELTELIAQLHGELGTSHAFHQGAAHRTAGGVGVGKLGVDVEWDEAYTGYRILTIYRGDPGTYGSGPLSQPGVLVEEGDVIQKINGIVAKRTVSLDEMLIGLHGTEVKLTVLNFRTNQDPATLAWTRTPVAVNTYIVQPVWSERAMRFRDWINDNRDYVDRKTDGRVGYIHMPSMSNTGWSEFHRGYIAQANKEALILDLRYNTGGFISGEISDKVSRKTLGFMKSRWGKAEPYPNYSSLGPKVILVNEGCASDCEIFSAHVCTRLDYGVPCFHKQQDIDSGCVIIGERTWGGVVGINWKGDMIDYSSTSQPEFAHWFVPHENGPDGRPKNGVDGWGVENHGVSPDITVTFRPQDYRAQEDPQLERALEFIDKVMHRDSDFMQRQETCMPDIDLSSRCTRV